MAHDLHYSVVVGGTEDRGTEMFRVEFQEYENTTVLKLFGRLVEEYVEAARLLVARSQPKSRFVVDLSDMIQVDEAGEEFLQWLKCIGAQFVAGDVYSCGVCDRLHLPRLEGNAVPNRTWTVRCTFASHG